MSKIEEMNYMGNNNPGTERSSKLPDEILGAEKCRADYLKWKLLLVAVLGAAGYGVTGSGAGPNSGGRGRPLVLALIPFVCMYVDLVCTNLKWRIMVIGTFYATQRQDPYELFVNKSRNAFQMEDWALYVSTYVICVILILIGISSRTPDQLSWKSPRGESLIQVIAGAVGILVSSIIQVLLHKSKKEITNLTQHGANL